jgi:hypothetical protein
MTEQLIFDFKDQDTEYTYNNRNILTVSEIRRAGFLYTAFTAFVVHPETDEVWNNGLSWSHENGYPKLAYTFLLGEAKEWDTRPIKPEIKQQAIDQMKSIGIKWVHQVYFGDIYIPKDKINGARYYHMFARATVKQLI